MVFIDRCKHTRSVGLEVCLCRDLCERMRGGEVSCKVHHVFVNVCSRLRCPLVFDDFSPKTGFQATSLIRLLGTRGHTGWICSCAVGA